MEINKIFQGHILDTIKQIPDDSIDCVITSPPYYGLRAYKVSPTIWGGDTNCNHEFVQADVYFDNMRYRGENSAVGNNKNPDMYFHKGQVPQTINKGNNEVAVAGNVNPMQDSSFCINCGAWLGNLGLEPSMAMYIDHLVMVFDECKRIIKPTGSIWINIGDSYNTQHKSGTTDGQTGWKHGELAKDYQGRAGDNTLPVKSLMGIPERLSIALTDRLGLIKRNTVIWCLCEDTKLFVNDCGTYKKISIQDARIGMDLHTQNLQGDTLDVKIKNVFNNGQAECIKITTGSGREVICTPQHKFVVKQDNYVAKLFRKITVVPASEIEVGDCLYTNEHLNLDIPNGDDNDYSDGFVVGFFLAEGSYVKNKDHHKVGLQFSCGIKDIKRGYIEYLKRYNVYTYIYGKSVHIRSRNKELLTLITSFVDNEHSDKKHLCSLAFNQSVSFINGILEGFIAGDGSYDIPNDRHRIGICINKELVEDICIICRILGYQFRVSYRQNGYKGIADMTIRKKPKQQRIMGCIVDSVQKIEYVGVKNVYDIEVENIYHGRHGKYDSTNPRLSKYNNLYFLANGIWTHNCKTNPCPQSMRDRFSVDFEYVYFFTKNNETSYWVNNKTGLTTATTPKGTNGCEHIDWDWVKHNACNGQGCSHKRCKDGYVKESYWSGRDYYFEQQFEPLAESTIPRMKRGISQDMKYVNGETGLGRQGLHEPREKDDNREAYPMGRNKRCVWNIATEQLREAHYAPFPTKLIEPMLKSSVPRYICDTCGLPREKIFDNSTRINTRTGDNTLNGKSGQIDDPNQDLHKSDLAKYRQQILYKSTGYTTCSCDNPTYHAGIVFDPFMGSGTTAIVAKKMGLNYLGCELSKEYMKIIEKRLDFAVELTLFDEI